MEKIKVVTVDDEPLARGRLRTLLQHDPEVDLVAECVDGYEAVSSIRKLRPDLVFLDIQMPEKDGFKVVEEIGVEIMPVVIFVTAYDEYALRAFQVCGLDYLLKPFDQSRFEQTLQRAKTQIASARRGDVQRRMLSLLEEWKARSSYLERIVIKTGGRLFFLKTSEVDWIKVEGNYVRFHVGKSNYLLRETLNHLETQLDPEKFLRIHRSAMVNIDRVKEIQQMFHGEHRVVLKDGTELTLSRSYREKLPRFAAKSS
jgi:two-component system LytT family response regulator